ncbi:MAG: RidA/YER057c/UK114 superfamily, group 1, partial [uncultured Sphingomonas sp.]
EQHRQPPCRTRHNLAASRRARRLLRSGGGSERPPPHLGPDKLRRERQPDHRPAGRGCRPRSRAGRRAPLRDHAAGADQGRARLARPCAADRETRRVRQFGRQLHRSAEGCQWRVRADAGSVRRSGPPRALGGGRSRPAARGGGRGRRSGRDPRL